MNYTYEDYSLAPDPSHRPMYLADVLRSLEIIPKGAKILDAGCGGGDFSIGLSEAGYDVYGSDMSQSGINTAEALGIGTFKQASVYDNLAAPFSLICFDAIVSIEVVEHLYSPKTFARRLFESVSSGGIVIISTPYWGYLKNIVISVSGRMDRSLTALWEGGHIKHFSKDTLGKLMVEQGFEVLGFKGCGNGWRAHVPWLWNGMLMTFRKPIL
jgi:2-polyprenyl-3-methyl-5-hydroxy-6-metoxy-1,4-benzoquinol methylase